MHMQMQVRNLNYLNRDLDKVLLITANADAYELHPDNAVKVRHTSHIICSKHCREPAQNGSPS